MSPGRQLGPAVATGQARGPSDRNWALITRVLVTGSSDESTPPGYKVFSAVTLEAGVRRSFGRFIGAELTVRTESREVDSLVPSGEDRRLGSLELVPVDLLLQFRLPTGGRLHPYDGRE